MRFALHGSDSLTGIQIDWSAAVDVDPALRAAMAGHDVDTMQTGQLRRGYHARAITYPRGTIAIRIAEGHEIFLQVPTADERPRAPARPEVDTVATVDRRAEGDRHRVVVGDGDDGARIDLIIAGAVPPLSRAVAQRLIDDGQVTVGGAVVAKSNRRLHRGDVIDIDLAATVQPAP